MSPLEEAMLKGIGAAHERWNKPFEKAEWLALVEPLGSHLRTLEGANGDAH